MCTLRRGPIDVLFVDEAGQPPPSPDVLAAGTSARSLVPARRSEPRYRRSRRVRIRTARACRSFQHLLGDHITIPPDRGLFLGETWRLRPELCDFTSDAYYEGRLEPAPVTSFRSLAAGNGPVWLAVAHEAPEPVVGRGGRRGCSCRGGARRLAVHSGRRRHPRAAACVGGSRRPSGRTTRRCATLRSRLPAAVPGSARWTSSRASRRRS